MVRTKLDVYAFITSNDNHNDVVHNDVVHSDVVHNDVVHSDVVHNDVVHNANKSVVPQLYVFKIF